MSHTSNAKRLNGERSCRLDVEMAKVEPPTATLAAGVLADEAIQPAFQSPVATTELRIARAGSVNTVLFERANGEADEAGGLGCAQITLRQADEIGGHGNLRDPVEGRRTTAAVGITVAKTDREGDGDGDGWEITTRSMRAHHG
jgi:hypothetical protein